MNKDEFLNRLSELLSDVSEAERDEALKYYRDYFDEAGSWNEQNVISELVSPENVAETIKQSLGDEAFYDNCEYSKESSAKAQLVSGNAGTADECGSSGGDYTGSQETGTAYGTADSQGQNKKQSSSNTGEVAAIIIACVLLSPAILSVASAVLSGYVSIACIILAFTVLIAVCPFALSIGGIAAVVAGAIKFMTNASAGALIFGCGLTALGISLIGYVIFWLYFCRLVPRFFRWLTSFGTRKGGK